MRLPEVIKTIASAEAGAKIPSWRWSSLAKLLPDASPEILRQKIDADIAYMREENALWEFGFCHMGIYDCILPSKAQLLAKSFVDLTLPTDIAALIDLQNHSLQQASNLFIYFDPIISTSTSFDVASEFAVDKTLPDGTVSRGYVVMLQDVDRRNCPGEFSRCVRNDSEYPDEKEFQFLGYITGRELVGVVRGKTIIGRSQAGVYLQINSGEKLVLQQKVNGVCPEGTAQKQFDADMDQAFVSALEVSEFVCE